MDGGEWRKSHGMYIMQLVFLSYDGTGPRFESAMCTHGRQAASSGGSGMARKLGGK